MDKNYDDTKLLKQTKLNTNSDLSSFEVKDYTLVFLRKTIDHNESNKNENDDSKKLILLGMKLRGFGVGKWNGFGGKIEQGETIDEGAIREVKEECGLEVLSLQRVGYLVFKMNLDHKIMNVHVFESTHFTGEEATSDEMRPQWFQENGAFHYIIKSILKNTYTTTLF